MVFSVLSSLNLHLWLSFSLSCRISESSYCINWIRQPAGKDLEWLGYICNCGSNNIQNTVKNKISFIQDTSKNTVFLQGNNFQAEDSVYYCATLSQWLNKPQLCKKNKNKPEHMNQRYVIPGAFLAVHQHSTPALIYIVFTAHNNDKNYCQKQKRLSQITLW